jgi:hypothetical protein
MATTRLRGLVVTAAVLLAALAPLGACAPARSPSSPAVVLRTPQGADVPFDPLVEAHALTVVTFFSATCPCQRAHDARLVELMAKVASSDVGFVVVDSEVTTTREEDAEQSKLRGYPIVRDEGAALAKRLDAEYATFSVVLDRHGKVLYRGGIDSDKSHMHEGRTQYLANALEDAIAGRTLRQAEAKTLGCVLGVN